MAPTTRDRGVGRTKPRRAAHGRRPSINARTMIGTIGLAAAASVAAPVEASMFMSVRDNFGVELGGLTFLDGDVVEYDAGTDTASIYLSESAFTSGSIDINALHVRSSGNIVLSTLFNGAIGGLRFGDGDIIEYDPVFDAATVLVPETAWTGGAATDVNAVYVRDNGRVVLSHNNELDMLGGLAFTDGDLVEYDPFLDIATLLVPEFELFDDGDGDIDAVHQLDGGDWLMSFQDDELISGVAFNDGDLVRYDAATGAASLFLSESIFDSKGIANDLNAFSMAQPVPGPTALGLLGALGLARRRHRAA